MENTMTEDYRTETDRKYAGLSTAALAEVGEPAALTSGGAPTLVDRTLAPAGVAATAVADDQATPLFSLEEAKEFRNRWDTIQGGFVDEPRRAVEQADSLVAGTMKRLAEIFAEERAKLEGQLDRDQSVPTENLRLALRRYRSFFGRLLSV
jgi:hypothetical protein